MPIEFDAITPVPTPEQVQQMERRTLDRQKRQLRFGDERRSQLLDVAWLLWQEAGEQGFNMRQLAQRAGYTAGALYAYFPGRDAILGALQQRVIHGLGERVRALRPSRVERSVRSSADGAPSGVASLQARKLYVERTLAWWGGLAGDNQCLQLVLYSGHGRLPVDEGGAASVLLARLADAVQPCHEALLATGLSAERALQLHDEVLAYGLGLLVLQGPQRTGLPATMEPRFVQSLHRWLDLALAATRSETDAPSPLEQGDLFSM